MCKQNVHDVPASISATDDMFTRHINDPYRRRKVINLWDDIEERIIETSQFNLLHHKFRLCVSNGTMTYCGYELGRWHIEYRDFSGKTKLSKDDDRACPFIVFGDNRTLKEIIIDSFDELYNHDVAIKLHKLLYPS